MLVTLRTDKSVVMFSESFIEKGLQELAHVDVSYNFTQELSSKTQVTKGLCVPIRLFCKQITELVSSTSVYFLPSVKRQEALRVCGAVQKEDMFNNLSPAVHT